MQNLSLVTLENIVKILPIGVVIISKDNGKVCYVNDRAIQLYGVDPSGLELANHSTKLMKLLTLNGKVYPPEEFPASKALLTGEKSRDELIIERPDGSKVIVSAFAIPIKEKNGEIVAALKPI